MRGRSWMGWAAVVVATMGVGATNASAATINLDVPIAGTITSSCTGELIAIDGSMHVKQTDNASLGGVKYQIEMNLTGVTGTTLAPVAGVRYVMNEQTSDMQHADVDDVQLTLENTSLLLRQRETGTFPFGGDDLRLHTLVHLTIVNGVTKADKVEFRGECR